MKILCSFLVLSLFCVPCWAGVDFTGQDADYVGFGDHNDFTIPATGMTWAFWLKLDAYPTEGSGNRMFIFSKGKASNFEWAISMQDWTSTHANSNQLYLEIWAASGGKEQSRAQSGTLSLNTWYHVAFTTASGSAIPDCYVNGVLDNGTSANPSSTGNTNGTAEMWLGDIQSGAEHPLNGKVSELALWKDDLTATEVLLLASAKTKRLPLQVQPDDLLLYLPLDDYPEGHGTLASTTWVDVTQQYNGSGVDADNDSDVVAEAVLSYP